MEITPINNVQTLRIVPHLDSSHALVFPIKEYALDGTESIKIGRSIAERRVSNIQMTFKSKVVSRRHAEIYLQDGKVYLRDIQSSSGTFLNSRRLCAPNTISQPFEIHDNDIIQLGVDYQGGTQEIYRCVRMRLELNKQEQSRSDGAYNLKTFNSLRNLTTPPNNQQYLTGNDSIMKDKTTDEFHVEECCICLYAISPFQALFVSPCSHTFHYKCLRPLLANHPGFLCPLCRKYADLDASVAVEVDEVKLMLTTMKTVNIEQDELEEAEAAEQQAAGGQSSSDTITMMLNNTNARIGKLI